MPKGLVLEPGYKFKVVNIAVDDSDDDDEEVTLSSVIGGYFYVIDSVFLKKKEEDPFFTIVGYANEEGLLKNLKKNEWSTFLQKRFHFKISSPIVGPIVLFNGTDDGEDEDISSEIIEDVKVFQRLIEDKKKRKKVNK